MKLYNMCRLREASVNEDIAEFKIQLFWDENIIFYDRDSYRYLINNKKDESFNYQELVEYFFNKIFN